MNLIPSSEKNIPMKTVFISNFAVLILITLCGPAEINHALVSTVQSNRPQSHQALHTPRNRSQILSSLQARIHIVEQQITTLQAQIAALEAAHNVRVDPLQKILVSPQSRRKVPTKKGAALPEHSVGFRSTPLESTLSVNGVVITLTPATLSIQGGWQIVLQANIIHLKSQLKSHL